MSNSNNECKNICIILKPGIVREFNNLVPNLVQWLQRRKKSVYFLEKEEDRVTKIFQTQSSGKLLFLPVTKLQSQVDLIISLGGDGTLIGISRKIGKSKVPVFGVNMGHLGFITEFTKKHFYEDLANYFKGDLVTKTVHQFTIEVFNKKKLRAKEYFINEAAISKHDISRIISLSVEDKDEHIFNISGDGIIISSPIGSTAYSMAAGGPIIHPKVNSLVITPICPHSLTHRPLVLPDKLSLKIKLIKESSNVILTLDGQKAIEISKDDTVFITKDKARSIRLVENPDRTFFQSLKEKFDHGKRSV